MDSIKNQSLEFLEGMCGKQKDLVQTINQSMIERKADTRNAFSDLLGCFRKLSYVSKTVSPYAFPLIFEIIFKNHVTNKKGMVISYY